MEQDATTPFLIRGSNGAPPRVRLRPWWSQVLPGQFRRDDGTNLVFGPSPRRVADYLNALAWVDRAEPCPWCPEQIRQDNA